MEREEIKNVLSRFLGISSLLPQKKPRVTPDLLGSLRVEWNSNVFNTSEQCAVEEKMYQVMVENLPKIYNLEDLMVYWHNTEPIPMPRELIKSRIFEVLSDIGPERIPEDFLNLCENGLKIPVVFWPKFQERARAILDSI